MKIFGTEPAVIVTLIMLTIKLFSTLFTFPVSPETEKVIKDWLDVLLLVIAGAAIRQSVISVKAVDNVQGEGAANTISQLNKAGKTQMTRLSGILLPFLLASGLLLAGCASSVKERVVVAYQATEFSLGSFQDAERALYAAKTVPQLTDQRHRDISAALQAAFGAQKTFGKALLIWRTGQPVPTETKAWFAEIERVLGEVQKLDTGGRLPIELAQEIVKWAKAIVDVATLLKVSPPAAVTAFASQ